MRRAEATGKRRNEVAHIGAFDLFGTWPGHEDVARHALLQQQFGRLDDRVGVEAFDHDPVVQHVAERHQRHPLVMRHVAVHDCDCRAFRQTSRRVVECLPEAVAAAAAGLGQAGEVADGGLRIDHRRQAGGVRSDHQVIAQPTLQAEARHAEARVLVGLGLVTGVETRLGDAPRHALLRGVLHLPGDHEPVGLLEQAVGRGAHHQHRHEELEHRPGPGDQRRPAADGGERSAQPEPVVRRHIALGDRDETGQAGLGGEQVVVARIQRAFQHAVPDREQLARRVEEEPEVHLVEVPIGHLGDRLQPSHERRCCGGPFGRWPGRRVGELGNGRQRTVRRGVLGDHEIPRVAADRRARRFCPGDELTVLSVVAFCRQCRGDIRQRAGERGVLAESSRPVTGVRDLVERRPVERVVEVATCDRLAPSVVADHLGCLAGQSDRVVDPVERGLDGQRLVDHLSTGVRQRQKMPSEVAAVDRRDVRGFQPTQVARVVPVVEVPAEMIELADRLHRRLEPFDHLRRADPTEVSRRHRGQQVHPDVRGRRAMFDHGGRVVLEVVGR